MDRETEREREISPHSMASHCTDLLIHVGLIPKGSPLMGLHPHSNINKRLSVNSNALQSWPNPTTELKEQNRI